VVKAGLKQGEKIVVNGLQRVRPGSPITAQTVPMVATTSTGKDKSAQLAMADAK
jgi:multidrug efflux system membrane fusion protein